MTSKRYSFRHDGYQGEMAVYTDDDVRLFLGGSFYEPHSIDYRSTSGLREGLWLPFPKRQEVIENLCDFFDTRKKPMSIEVEEKDKDRASLETMCSNLVSKGHRIKIKYDNGEFRARIEKLAGPELRLHSAHFRQRVRREWKLPSGELVVWVPVRIIGMTATEVGAVRGLLKQVGDSLYPGDAKKQDRLTDGTVISASVWEDWLDEEYSRPKILGIRIGSRRRGVLGIRLKYNVLTRSLADLVYDLAVTAQLLVESEIDPEAVACPWTPRKEVLARWPRARTVRSAVELWRFLTDNKTA